MGKKRLITRSDMDGLVCAVLLKHLGLIEDILFVHPKDMQDGKIAVSSNDISTNLPYVPGIHLAFDHHASEALRNEVADNHIIIPTAPSSARVVYEYYGDGHKNAQGTGSAIDPNMIRAVDKADSGAFSIEDIVAPQGWELLSFIMDARTGLGRFKNFTLSNYTLMMRLIDECLHHTVEHILQLPDVQERIQLYFSYQEHARNQILRCAKVHHNVVVLDLRTESTIYPTNRFLIYALYPQCNLSIHVMHGRQQNNTVFAVGKSIITRTSPLNIGALMLSYGGGGHHGAGTCQVPNSMAHAQLRQLIDTMQLPPSS